MSAIPGYKKVIRIWVTDEFLNSIFKAGKVPAANVLPRDKWIPIPTESASLNVSGDLIDDTEMASNNGYRSRIYGLLDWSLSLTFNVEDPDDTITDEASAQKRAIKSVLLAAKLARKALWVQYLPSVSNFLDQPTGDTTNGISDNDLLIGVQGSCVVESWSTEGEVSGKESVTCPLQGNSKLDVSAADDPAPTP